MALRRSSRSTSGAERTSRPKCIVRDMAEVKRFPVGPPYQIGWISWKRSERYVREIRCCPSYVIKMCEENITLLTLLSFIFLERIQELLFPFSVPKIRPTSSGADIGIRERYILGRGQWSNAQSSLCILLHCMTSCFEEFKDAHTFPKTITDLILSNWLITSNISRTTHIKCSEMWFLSCLPTNSDARWV